LSFDLGAIKAFETKMDLETLDFVVWGDNVEDTCCPAMKPYLNSLFQEPHNKQIELVVDHAFAGVLWDRGMDLASACIDLF
jgi:hypothetical protein